MPKALHTLDVRDKKCPLTFVHAKVLVESMESGEEAVIYYSELESKRLPESLTALEIEMLSVERNTTEAGFVLLFKKL
jgi:TusA-related sulfurtransferase